MLYEITAPNKKYNRRINCVQFVNGKAETENERAAQWFSGREGFTVNVKKSEKAEEKASELENAPKEENSPSAEEVKAEGKSKNRRTK